MLRKLLASEKGIVDVPFLMFISALALFAIILIYINFVNPPKKAEDLNVFNSAKVKAPVAQCETKGILREKSSVSLTVVDEKGQVIETVPEARVYYLTNNAVWVLVKREDCRKIPPLSVNRLRVVLEPKG